MNALEFQFNKQVIEFDVSGADVMINATEMGKIFGKRPIDFLKKESTKAFIEELKSVAANFESDSASLSNAGNGSSSIKNIVRSERGGDDMGATWMHRQLALKFAAWMDPKFEVWIYQTIDTLLFEHARKTTEELKEKAKLSDRRTELVQELQGNPKFQEYMEVEFKIRQANNRIIKTNNSQLGLFRNLQD